MPAQKLCRPTLPIFLLLLTACSGQRLTHENLNSTLWTQTASEHDALTAEVFALAALRLDQALADPGWSAALEQQEVAYADLPPAIIVDVDETILDNAPFQAQLIVDRQEYSSERWARWVARGSAKALPGAKAFLDHAAERGVTVFYVTNRNSELEAVTRANLEQEGLPLEPALDVVLTRGEHDWPSDKTSRRAEVAKSHRILLLLGDDLNDFVSDTLDGQPVDRRMLAEQHQAMWGLRWLVLPNADYGSWEASLYGRNFKLGRAQKLRRKRAHLEPYG